MVKRYQSSFLTTNIGEAIREDFKRLKGNFFTQRNTSRLDQVEEAFSSHWRLTLTFSFG